MPGRGGRREAQASLWVHEVFDAPNVDVLESVLGERDPGADVGRGQAGPPSEVARSGGAVATKEALSPLAEGLLAPKLTGPRDPLVGQNDELLTSRTGPKQTVPVWAR